MVQVSSLRFGPLSSGPLPLDCSVSWRDLPQGGVGINTNYLMDISPEWRSAGGPTFLESMKVRTSYTQEDVNIIRGKLVYMISACAHRGAACC